MGSEFDARNFHDYVGNSSVVGYGHCNYMETGDPAKVIYSTQSLDRRKLGGKLRHTHSFKEEVSGSFKS